MLWTHPQTHKLINKKYLRYMVSERERERPRETEREEQGKIRELKKEGEIEGGERDTNEEKNKYSKIEWL